MDDRRYKELLDAIFDLRGATEAGFNRVDRRFDELEERWNRRFGALENRVEDGFRTVSASVANIASRLNAVEHG